MLLIAGTVPDKEIPLTFGDVTFDGDIIEIDGKRILPFQGTGACILSALMVHGHFGTLEGLKAAVAGDTGDGQGSRKLYSFLEREIPSISPKVVVLHYILPLMAMMRKVVLSCKRIPEIKLIADAGSMYAAKAAGIAREFEVFTPDMSELAFLADEKATHPAYIGHHLFSQEGNVEELVRMAYSKDNASRVLTVKGEVDYIVVEGSIMRKVHEPNIPSLEAIGGTGDTITGLLSAFISAGLETWHACWIACMMNRHAGLRANPTPATRISDIIRLFPEILKDRLLEWSGKASAIGGRSTP